LVVVTTLTVAFIAYRRWDARRRRGAARRKVEEAEPAAIASLPQGAPTRIIGVVAPRDAMLTSPIERQACIGYHTVIEQGEGEWRPILTAAVCGAFLVTDESGTVSVEGPIVIALDPDDGAWRFLPATWFDREFDDSASKLSPALWPRALFSEAQQIRYQEAVLRPGDRVSVLGRATLEIDPAGPRALRDPPMLNHIRGLEDEPVIVARV
jgi:hypothetical protein